MNERDCPKCGTPVLFGYAEGLVELTLSRQPVDREYATRAYFAGKGFVGVKRAEIGTRIHSQLWHNAVPSDWTILAEHDCKEWK